jgi:plastocyanin
MARAVGPTEEDGLGFRKAAVLGLLVIALVGMTAMLSAGALGAAKTTIKLDDDFFAPDKKSVKKGTTVRFKWVGDDKHNVVKKSGPGGSFSSETTDARGVNYTKKFKKAGKYKIVCTIHDKMKLTLKVN